MNFLVRNLAKVQIEYFLRKYLTMTLSKTVSSRARVAIYGVTDFV